MKRIDNLLRFIIGNVFVEWSNYYYNTTVLRTVISFYSFEFSVVFCIYGAGAICTPKCFINRSIFAYNIIALSNIAYDKSLTHFARCCIHWMRILILKVKFVFDLHKVDHGGFSRVFLHDSKSSWLKFFFNFSTFFCIFDLCSFQGEHFIIPKTFTKDAWGWGLVMKLWPYILNTENPFIALCSVAADLKILESFIFCNHNK